MTEESVGVQMALKEVSKSSQPIYITLHPLGWVLCKTGRKTQEMSLGIKLTEYSNHG